MQKRIILHVTPSLMVGGAEKLLIDLLATFQNHPQNHFEHQVIYFQAGPYLQDLNQLKIKSYQINGLINHYDPFCFWRLLKLIQKIKPHTIHAMLWTANFYSRLIGRSLKIPTFCAIHSNYNSGNLTRDNWIKDRLDRYTLNWGHKIIVVSQELQHKFSDPTYLLKPDQLIMINNGVNMPTNLKLNLTNRPFTIGHVGRLVPVKNQQLLITALGIIKTKIPNFKAIIIGHGPLESQLKQLAAKLDLLPNIDFIKTNHPAKYYPLFDCFVLPSHQEGQSIALLEAMSWGITPVITPANPPHDVVQHLYNGLICKPNQPGALAQAILNIYEKPHLKIALAKQAYQTVKNHFNLDQVARNYLALYDRYLPS